MTFRTRLLLAQAPLAAALLLVGVASLRTVTTLGRSAERSLHDNYRSAVAAQRMSAALEHLNRETLLRAIGWHEGGPADLQMERFEAELQAQQHNVTEAGEAEATKRLEAAWRAYRHLAQETAAAPDARSSLLGPLQQARAAVEDATDEILALNADAMARRGATEQAMARRLGVLMMLATLVALALGLLASWSLTARTLRPLSTLTAAVRRFGEGHAGARAHLTGPSELAALGREYDTMADRLDAYRRSSLGALLVAQQSAQAAIDSLFHPVLVLDAGGIILTMNRTAESLLDLPRDQGLGRPVQALAMAPGLRERLEAARLHVIAGGEPYLPHRLDEAILVSRAEGQRRLLPQAAVLRNGEGEAVGVTVVLQDVTRLVRFDQLRSDLVATVAHEFRTPLTSLQLAIHLLGDGAAGSLTPRQASLVTGARTDCERLLDAVDEILDLSRIEAGHLSVQARPAEADRLLESAVAAAEAPARAAGVRVSHQRGGALPVLADPDRLGLVLANLLGNAIRHSERGGLVTARASRKGLVVRFEVEDAGPGIAPEHVDRIFERFFQVPGARAGNIGLGLYIAREIVVAHGGTMGVQTSPGRGSTFWFTLPVA